MCRKLCLYDGHDGKFIPVSQTADYYQYIDKGVDENDGSTYQTEFAALYFDKSKRDAAYDALLKKSISSYCNICKKR